MAATPFNEQHSEGTEMVEKAKEAAEHEEEEEADDNELPTPPDGGWGWVVVFASFLIHIIADGVAYSFGVFIVEFLNYFPGSGRGELGWISSLMVGVTLGSGPIASILTNKYGCRLVTILGALIASFGFIISIFAPSVFYLYFTFGVTAGLGLGLIYLPAIVSVTYYFEKKRAFATGLAVCGSGIGTFIFAPLSQYLMEEYGWRGAALIEAGLLLNCVVCGALFRPLEHSKKRRKRAASRLSAGNTVNSNEMILEVKENGQIMNGNAASHVPLLKASSSLRHIPNPHMEHLKHGDGVKQASSEVCLKAISDSPHPKHHGVMERKDVLYTGSLHNIPLYRSNPALYTQSVTSLHKTEVIPSPPEDVESKNCCQCLPVSCQCSPETKKEFQQMMDITLLKDPLFIMFAVSNFFTSIGFNSPYIYLPDKAVLLGISYSKASFLISVIGIANTVGRVVFGFLADRKFINRLMLYNTALTLCGISTALSALCVTYPWLVAYSATYGLFIGVYVSLTSVVLVDLLGLERLTSSFGLLLLFQGIATVVGPPLCGSVYDRTKDYAASFYIIGTMIAVSGAMLYFIPCVRRCMERRGAGASDHDQSMGRL